MSAIALITTIINLVKLILPILPEAEQLFVVKTLKDEFQSQHETMAQRAQAASKGPFVKTVTPTLAKDPTPVVTPPRPKGPFEAP